MKNAERIFKEAKNKTNSFVSNSKKTLNDETEKLKNAFKG